MTEKKVYDAVNKPTELDKQKIVKFLYTHLEEYGDSKEDIKKAIDYAVKDTASFGGFILEVKVDKVVAGVVVLNCTGMSGYIPPNILVYIAVHKDYRGKGIGKILMEKTVNLSKGDIALHVEKDNPARLLYEKVGFKNPYLEMRLKK